MENVKPSAGHARTAAARAARTNRKLQRFAAELRNAGYLVIEPGDAGDAPQGGRDE